MYYKLKAQGKAPATLPIGRHRTITAEADAAWARERQAEANTKKVSEILHTDFDRCLMGRRSAGSGDSGRSGAISRGGTEPPKQAKNAVLIRPRIATVERREASNARG